MEKRAQLQRLKQNPEQRCAALHSVVPLTTSSGNKCRSEPSQTATSSFMAHATKKGVCKVGVLLERSGAGTMFREERSEPSAISLVLILLIQFAWMYGLLGQKKKIRATSEGWKKNTGMFTSAILHFCGCCRQTFQSSHHRKVVLAVPQGTQSPSPGAPCQAGTRS